jgi:hypothetical protein
MAVTPYMAVFEAKIATMTVPHTVNKTLPIA